VHAYSFIQKKKSDAEPKLSLLEETVDFIITLSNLTEQQHATLPSAQLLPIAAFGISIAFNVESAKTKTALTSLNMSIPVLAR